MFKYLLLVSLIALVRATDDDSHAHVEKEFHQDDGHHFSYGFGLTNGIAADEAGDETKVEGKYRFISKEGEVVEISYVADENGFHPMGAGIPQPPPTPPAILKALEYIKTHPKKGEQDTKKKEN